MRSKEFLARLDHKRISDAIAEAELRTSGEIRVYVHRGSLEGDALPLAQQKFQELGMEKTAARNAVLILVAPRAQKFAVIGDEGVHQKCGAEFWEQLVAEMRTHFKSENFTEAILHGIRSTGELLARFFARENNDRDELPNDVIEG
ncbi:MAG: TPM domain-containing protein [Chthoniobacterales bacterium]